jgi:hypothetical protein
MFVYKDCTHSPKCHPPLRELGTMIRKSTNKRPIVETLQKTSPYISCHKCGDSIMKEREKS